MGLGQALVDLGDQRGALLVANRIFGDIDNAKNSPIDGLSSVGLTAPPDIDGRTVINRAKGRIELRNVHFRYPTRPEVEVCKGYNLVIEPGQTVALVGPSGSGKVNMYTTEWHIPLFVF